MKIRKVQHRPTRSDVAARAGVSKTTVTYALGDNYAIAIPESTRQRVKQAAVELGYHPNAIAQALVSGKTNTATIAFHRSIEHFYSQVIQVFERRTNEMGYHLIASTFGHDGCDSAGADFASLLSGPNDAVILVDTPEIYQSFFAPFLPTTKPVVSMGINRITDMDCVHVDLLSGAREAMRHLLATNPKRLALFDVILPRSVDDMLRDTRAGIGDPREIAYVGAMDEAGKHPEVISMIYGTRRHLINRFKEYVAANGCPDAIFCFTDELAVCAHRGLREMGFRIPEDVLLVGCDGIEETESLDPQITTIAQPLDAMCTATWRLLKARLAEPSIPLEYVPVKPELLIRGSSTR